MGVGAIGAVAAARMAPHAELVLVDTWPEHVHKMQSDGLVVDCPEGTATVAAPAFHLAELDRIGGAPDAVLLAVKSTATEETVRALEPQLPEDAVVVSLQNAINEETIARIVGSRRTIGAVVRFDGRLDGPGHATSRNASRKLTLGELDGASSPRLRALADSLGAGIPTHVTGDIWGLLWTKLIRNCEFNALGAVSGLDTLGIAADPAARRLALSLAAEAVQVALRLGYSLDCGELHGPAEAYLEPVGEGAMLDVEQAFVASTTTATKSSMLQDVEKGRRTEIDHINGYVVRKGAECGVQTPLNAAVVSLVKALERGEGEPGRAALEELMPLASA